MLRRACQEMTIFSDDRLEALRQTSVLHEAEHASCNREFIERNTKPAAQGGIHR